MSKRLSKFKRKCVCGKILFYVNKYNLQKAITNNRACRSCSKIGSNNPSYNKGYRQLGKKNPNYGNPNNCKHTEETKKKISIKNKGRKRADILGDKNPMKKAHIKANVSRRMTGENNHRYGKRPWNYGFGTHKLSKFKKYKRQVWNITKKNIKDVPGFDPKRRGRAGVKDAYQIDHIVSIKDGFNKNIEPDIIGGLKNLQFIPWEENIRRRDLNNFRS